MRLFLAAAVLCASALAQWEDDSTYDDELQARDARDATWQAAHGGKAPSYRGFDQIAHGYPGHPAKSFGSRHHARDVEEDGNKGDADGFIGATANFANNIARAVKNVGHKAEEAVSKAQGSPQKGWKPAGAQLGAKDKHYAGRGDGRPLKLHQRDVEDDEDVDEADYDNEDLFDDDEEDYSALSARDVEEEDDEDLDDIDWDFTTSDEDDNEGSQLAEPDVEDDGTWFVEDGEADQLERRDVEDDEEDDPSTTAFDTDDEELPDPKLQLEEEFDEGVEDTDAPTLVERDAEPFNFFGFGKKDDHKGFTNSQREAWKKGRRHVFARDGAIEPEEDDELDGAYDDEDFYNDAEFEDEDDEDELEKRAVPSAATKTGTRTPTKIKTSVTKHTSKAKTKTGAHGTKTKTGAHPMKTGTKHATKTGTKHATKTGANHPSKTKTATKTPTKATGTAVPPHGYGSGGWGGWFGHW